MSDIVIRRFFLGFIKIHILYHAKEGPVCGVEMMKELRRHGYSVSPGLIYPTLHSLEKESYLKRKEAVVRGKMRKYYEATEKGVKLLEKSRGKIRALVKEVMK